MANVLGVTKVLSAFKRLERKFGPSKVSVIVGYTQNYAVPVHENLEAHHPIGQAKYLEQPARELAGEIGNITKRAVRGGATLEQGLLLGGLRLQRESQKLVPVDTGALKNSAFTKKE